MAVLAVLTVTGCGVFGPGSTDGEVVATSAAAYFRSVAGTDAKKVHCGEVATKVGARTSCTATDTQGVTWPMTAIVAQAGDDVTFRTHFDDRIADNITVQNNVADAIERKTGRAVARIECTGLQKLEVNAARTCTAVESNGSRWDVRQYLTNINGAVSVTFTDTLLYAKTAETIVMSLAWNLSKHFGDRSLFPAGSGRCDHMLRGTPGASIHCTAILADRTTMPVTLTAVESTGDRISFTMHPDDRPDLSMSGWQLADPS